MVLFGAGFLTNWVIENIEVFNDDLSKHFSDRMLMHVKNTQTQTQFDLNWKT